jgi:hypothetical protein|tara:strand:+ start:2425 stop:2739 length:315 start_codon:yes stop_codon:yes gene_type:complete
MAKSKGGLTEWFKQDWVDIGAPKKGGGYAKCGRSKLEKDRKRKYPKCVPAAKAARMSKAQIKSAVRRKRAKKQGVGGKPTNVKTFVAKGGMITNRPSMGLFGRR